MEKTLSYGVIWRSVSLAIRAVPKCRGTADTLDFTPLLDNSDSTTRPAAHHNQSYQLATPVRYQYSAEHTAHR
jgi:hypothetical protein